jgi:hypothetical protein
MTATCFGFLFLNHLQVVTLGYFGVHLTLLVYTRSYI